MTGKIVGYKRVSTIDQNADSQLANIQLDKVYVDKISGTSRKRPQLDELMSYVRDGDTVVIQSMDRLARNLFDLQDLVNWFISNDTKVRFIREGLEFTRENDPMKNLMLSVMGAVAQFEREIIKERQREGIALAKARGAFSKSGRNRKLTPEDTEAALAEAFVPGVNRSEVARKYKVSRNLLYKLKREKEQKNG